MPRPKIEGSNGTGNATKPSVNEPVEMVRRARRQAATPAMVPQAPLPLSAANAAKKSEKKSDKPTAAAKGSPAPKKAPARAPKAEQAPAGKTPSKAEVVEAIDILKGLHAAILKASPVVKMMANADEPWPIADESRVGEHLCEQVYGMIATKPVDTSLDTLAKDVFDLIEDMAPGPNQGKWAKAILGGEKPGSAAADRDEPVAVFKRRLSAILEARGLSGRAFADDMAAMIARSHPGEAAFAPSRSTVNRWFNPNNDSGPWLVHMAYIAECLDTTIDAILDESIPADALPRRGESPEHAQLAAEEQEILKLARHLKRDEAIRRLMLADLATAP